MKSLSAHMKYSMQIEHPSDNHGRKFLQYVSALIDEVPIKRKTLAFTLLFLLVSSNSFSQSEVKHKVYYAAIEPESAYSAKGTPYDVTDSSVQLMDRDNGSIHSVSFLEIEKIKIRKKGTTGTAIAIGAGGGAALGALIGLATYRKPEPSDNWITVDFGPEGSAEAGAFIGLLMGTIVGAITGALRHKVIKVNHDAEAFSNVARLLKSYCQE